MDDERSARIGLSKRHKRTVVGAVGIMCFGLAVFGAIQYRFHLWWLLQERRLGSQQLVSIPDDPLPEVTVPDGWVRCRVGRLKFNLPPGLATNMVHCGEHEGGAVFEFGLRTVRVGPPTQATAALQLLSSGAAEIFGESECWTLPRLKLQCYRANSGMFSWSMSPSQVRRNAYIMGLCRIVRNSSDSDSRVEYLLGGDIDATLLLGKDRVMLDWECRKGGVGGYIHFVDREDDVDWSWVRRFCRSMLVSVAPVEDMSQTLEGRGGATLKIANRDHDETTAP